MTIQYCSDLHLEFPQNKQYLAHHPLVPKGDILLLAGDVVPFNVMDKHDDFFNFISDNFETTYWIPGNHEYYNFDLSRRCGSFQEKIRSNVFLVNNLSVDHDGIQFIFSTLWSKINQADEWTIQQSINDFHMIRYKGRRLTPADFNRQHRNCLDFLTAQLPSNKERTVVVTHHVPTLLNYPEKYQGDIFNQAFAVELFDLIESSGPKYWIHGHHHANTPAFSIGETQVLTNQLGYVRYGEHEFFDHGKLCHLFPE